MPPGFQSGCVNGRFVMPNHLIHELPANSIWFNTLSSLGPENVTFTDWHAQQPTVRCASIPRQSGDDYRIVANYSG